MGSKLALLLRIHDDSSIICRLPPPLLHNLPPHSTTMGCCLSCFEREKDAAGSSGSTNKETEMATKKSLSVSRSMTAPTIEVKDGIEVSGMGLALVGTTIEQDAAYWENHIQIPDSDGAYELMVGVATKKDRSKACFDELR